MTFNEADTVETFIRDRLHNLGWEFIDNTALPRQPQELRAQRRAGLGAPAPGAPRGRRTPMTAAPLMVEDHPLLQLEWFTTEFSAPLEDPTSAVHNAGLRLESIETRVVPCPFAAAFAEHGDNERFAEAYIPTLRSWTEATFFAALDGGRTVEERRDIIDRYYAEYQNRVREQPEGHAMDYVHIYMVLERV